MHAIGTETIDKRAAFAVDEARIVLYSQYRFLLGFVGSEHMAANIYIIGNW